MAGENKEVQQLQARIRLLEELLREVYLLWTQCHQEGSFSAREPGTASYDFLMLVRKIEKAVLPIEH